MKFLKRGLAIFLSAAICGSVMGLTAFAQGKRMMGDVNGDGKVTAVDVLLLRKHIAGQKATLDTELADVNLDEKLTAADVLLIRKSIAGAATLPDVPVKEYTVPESYVSEVKPNDVFINQIGYSVNAEKTAVIRTEKRKMTKECYLVDAMTNKAVFMAETNESSSETTIKTDKESRLYAATFDFSGWKTKGVYYIAAPEGRSYNFVISNSPYDSSQDKMITALYYNRCGQALDKNIVGEKLFHEACHCDDTDVFVLNLLDSSTNKFTANPKYKYTAADFSGGLHDAGDYGRYTRPGNGMVASLLVAADLFPKGVSTNIITDKAGENISDALDEVRYEMEWMFKMQNPENGGIYFRIANQTGWANSWYMPDKDFRSGDYALSRENVVASSGFAGNAAYCYTLFKDIDKDFANKCLEKGKKAYAFAQRYIGNEASGFDANFQGATEDPEYRPQAGDYGDNGANAKKDLFYAAAALYRATNDSSYKATADKLLDEGISLYGIDGYNTAEAGAVAYLINEKNDKTRQEKLLSALKATADSDRTSVNKSIIGCPFNTNNTTWGCNTQIADVAQNMAIVDYFTKQNDHEGAIRKIINFMFGTNGTGYSFVTGVGTKTPQNIHYRPSVCSGEVAPGWLVMGYCGGYWEDSGNEKVSEITIYTNATFITSLASIIQTDKTK